MLQFLAIFAVVHSAMAASTGTCSDNVPVIGETLLQHHAAREQTQKEKVHIDAHVKGGSQTSIYAASGSLPDHIYRLLDERLCNKSHRVQESILQTNGASQADLFKTASLMMEQVRGSVASLSESGYKGVVRSGNQEEVKIFIRRLAESCDLQVVDEGGLNGLAPWFTGINTTETPFQKLKMTLYTALLSSSSNQWVSYRSNSTVTGKSAPTDALGYVQVRALKDAEETKKWVRRLVQNMGIRIADERGFEGMANFYSDPYEYLGYFDLTKDIKKAANAHTWAAME